MAHIIAEAGTNHNGSKQKAKELIDLASRAKADSVKFQIINPWGLYLPGEYSYGHYDIKKVLKLRESTVLSDDVYRELAMYCNEQGIEFSSSVFDKNGLDLLCSLDPPYIKIASCDLNNIRFLRQVAETGKKVVLSTGMSSLSDIEKSLKEIEKSGNLNNFILLHCVSVYPAKVEQANLSFITTLKNLFGLEVGFSDHTGDSLAAVMALALGATWFEKHFTTDHTQEGLDHAYAMEEDGLTQYVEDIRTAEIALQPKEDKISDAERYTRKRARRSLYAARDLVPGEILKDDDVLCVRPEGILDADDIDLVIGKSVQTPIRQYEAFTFEKIG
ncbi:N-acetylneuraminate synthase family protein [Parapedobacter koreensis]|uniref:N-acetylneuraminate synthase n=1 Tax=Parapedobacter koreensis TaxID=332977 RepID=A0A1H7T902_9SPHI|nr:N-acetylneuraminate synthase family protein [Parapedobacter koreensis]SEL80307.1 N-acetylneuraminate synthase [Parapedobacter koreensis]